MTVEVLKRLALYHSWDWNSLGGSALLRVFALIRKVLPAATEDTALEHLSHRSPQTFESFLHSAENLDIVDNVLEGDDRKDAKAERDYGSKRKMVVAQLAEVATMVASKYPGSKIAQAILKASEDVGSKPAPARKTSTPKDRSSQFDPRVQDYKQHLPKVKGCRIQAVEAREVYYAEYPRDHPPRSHTKTWCADPAGGLSRERALHECWKWAWLAHEEKTGEPIPYALEWPG